jgi:hypothetical protein
VFQVKQFQVAQKGFHLILLTAPLEIVAQHRIWQAVHLEGRGTQAQDECEEDEEVDE